MIGMILAAAVTYTGLATSISPPDGRIYPHVQRCWTPLSEPPPKGYEYKGGCVWSPTPDVDRLGEKIISGLTPSLTIDMTAPATTLVVSAPPCGTPEASKAKACVRWVVSDATNPPTTCDLQWEANTHQWAAQLIDERLSLMIFGKIDPTVRDAREAITASTRAVRKACPIEGLALGTGR